MQLTIDLDELELAHQAQQMMDRAMRNYDRGALGQLVQDCIEDGVRKAVKSLDWPGLIDATVQRLLPGVLERGVSTALERLVKEEVSRQKKGGGLVPNLFVGEKS